MLHSRCVLMREVPSFTNAQRRVTTRKKVTWGVKHSYENILGVGLGRNANAIGFFARCPTELFARLPNSNIYLKLHSILTLLFKSLRLLEFIFEAIFYIERVKFLSSHSIQHYFRSKYSLQVTLNFEKASFVQVIHFNNISDKSIFEITVYPSFLYCIIR
ncbi:unnamed protein product [Rotaria magnacalcarata]|uniref:Uncharacterized protein n=1 Tax=Rotaria magnacalcarata TaxID=392030 RepID=A0A816K557_9BILA|nr:unnamed protein product [Rotaria magnacalcarata]